MVFAVPKYVEICYPGMDLIKKNQDLEIGSIYEVTALERLGMRTLEKRLANGWLKGLTVDDVRKRTEPIVEPETAVVVEPEVVETPPSEGIEQEKPEEVKPEVVSGEPIRDGLTLEEYWKTHISSKPDAKREVAKCPNCHKTKRIKRTLFECCVDES